MENQFNYLSAESDVDSLALVTIGEIEPSEYLSVFNKENDVDECIGLTD